MKKIGIDYYLIEHRLIDVIRICKQNNLDCFDVKVRKQGIQIAFLIKERKRIKQIFPQARFLYTSGLLGMLLRNFTNKTRLISYLSVILLWCFFTNTLFAVNIYGESDVLDKKIQTTLKDYLYKPKDTQAMKTMLYKKYHDKISWLEVYEKGSSISIRYALKKQVEKQVNDNMPLIAKKDGMIAYFQCNAGYKLKKVNDIVKAGDVLVDNHMPNSFNQSVPVNVNGKVYAYTWQKVCVEMEDNSLADAINYFSMLLEARNEIMIDIKNDEQLIKENILQFERNQGKIRLVILYTLLEDITS